MLETKNDKKYKDKLNWQTLMIFVLWDNDFDCLNLLLGIVSYCTEY
jgi:hypothetical protein